MIALMNEDADLELVSKYLLEHGLKAEHFSQAEIGHGKTPDFRVRKDSELVAYCEVKSPNDPWLDELLDEAEPGEVVGGLREDPVFNRLARHISKAARQFIAVNADRSFLNVLAYVNHDENSDFPDLIEALTGYIHVEGGKKYETHMHIAEGRISEAKNRIDAFLWFSPNRPRPNLLVNQHCRNRSRQAFALFGADSRRAKQW